MPCACQGCKWGSLNVTLWEVQRKLQLPCKHTLMCSAYTTKLLHGRRLHLQYKPYSRSYECQDCQVQLTVIIRTGRQFVR